MSHFCQNGYSDCFKQFGNKVLCETYCNEI